MATARDHAVKAEQLLEMADAPRLTTQHVDRLIAVAQVYADLAKVRLELEARAAENARTERLLAEVKPSPRSLDPRANRKAAEQRPRKKSTNDEGSAVASSEEPA